MTAILENRFVLSILLVAALFVAGLATAPPAEALSCSSGKVVWIKSNTSVNAGHGWNSGYDYWSSGGWHTTVTHAQNSGITWIDTDGT